MRGGGEVGELSAFHGISWQSINKLNLADPCGPPIGSHPLNPKVWGAEFTYKLCDAPRFR